MEVEKNDQGEFTERGWIDFGLENYYTLLNCGFELKPSAGTASGVHPVPLGFGRVYVHLEDGFDFRHWMDGLGAGRSFVTTGPIMNMRFNGKHAGTKFSVESRTPFPLRIAGRVSSIHPIETIEIIQNAEVVESFKPKKKPGGSGLHEIDLNHTITLKDTAWVAVRCFTRTDTGRPRFAHTAPIHFASGNKPIRPRKAEVDYLIKRVQDEITRHQDVLSHEALSEFQTALDSYKNLLNIAVPHE
ncbi:MAG: CehA/McbA family metallohydrolase [Verrucomicrobiota bacterium]